MSKIVVPLGRGFEEIEAISIIDVCRRANIDVIIAGVEELMVEGAQGIVVQTNCMIDDVDSNSLDMIVLPGGWGGTDILNSNITVQNMLKKMEKDDKFISAICAAPFALNTAGVLSENYTCYPSVEEQIRTEGYTSEQKVVKDGKILTSRGPGTAICFALEIVKILEGEDMYNMLKGGLLADFC
jgi:4-methyl-5(b-hydroxyethyl)-thiazole monophosphate biosynthesis